MQEKHTLTLTNTHIHVQTKNSRCLTFRYTIMLGDSSATPLVPCPLLLVCAMIQSSKSATGNVRCSCCGQKGYFDPSKEQRRLNVPCPHLAKKRTINITFGLDHGSKYLTFSHGTDVQSSYSATCAHISQGLTRTFFLREGADFTHHMVIGKM